MQRKILEKVRAKKKLKVWTNRKRVNNVQDQ